eukprot:RCo017613
MLVNFCTPWSPSTPSHIMTSFRLPVPQLLCRPWGSTVPVDPKLLRCCFIPRLALDLCFLPGRGCFSLSALAQKFTSKILSAFALDLPSKCWQRDVRNGDIFSLNCVYFFP